MSKADMITIRKIFPWGIPHEAARKVIYIVNISGGKDSTAVYLWAIERGLDFRAIFCNTGNEHPDTYAYIGNLSGRAGGPPIEIVTADFADKIYRRQRTIAKNWRIEKRRGGVVFPPQSEERIRAAVAAMQPTGNPFFDLCLSQGRFPGAHSRFCTQELKIEPMNDQVLKPLFERGYSVIRMSGERRQESRRRRGKRYMDKTVWKNEDGYVQHNIVIRPLLNWSTQDVFDLLKRHGLKANPLYQKGASRVGCWPCIMARKQELHILAQEPATPFDNIAHMETQVATVARRGAASYFPANTCPEGLKKYERGERPGIADVLEWAQAYDTGLSTRDMFERPDPDDLNVCDSSYCE